MILRPVPDALRALFLLALCLVCAMPAMAGEAVNSRPHYDVEVSWDPESGTFEASQEIRWTNRSAREVTELRLLHPWAALAATEGSWWRSARELGLKLPDEDEAPDVVVSALGAEDEDWSDRLEDAYEAGSGTYALTLPEPLAPREDAVFRIETRAQLETIVGRVGRHGDFLAAAGWLVRVAPFDAALHEKGEHPWADEPAHALVETQIEHFDARWSATLPARYAGKLAATGTLLDERVQGRRVHARWDAPQVVELALFADPRFVVMDARDVQWMALEKRALPRVFVQPEHRELAPHLLTEAFWSLDTLLELGGDRLRQVSIVDPPYGARGVSGMEYPDVVTVRVRAEWPDLSVETRRLLAHELAHQVFYAQVTSDNVREPFLEEGLATLVETWLSPGGKGAPLGPWAYRYEPLFQDPRDRQGFDAWGRIVRARFLGAGPRSLVRAGVEAAPLTWHPLEHSPESALRSLWLVHAGEARVRQDGRHFDSREELHAHAYSLAALVLEAVFEEHSIEGRVALKDFVARFRGRHASSSDLLDVLKQQPGVDPRALEVSIERYWDTVGWVDATVDAIDCVGEGDAVQCSVRFKHEGPWRPELEVAVWGEDALGVRCAWPADQEELVVHLDEGVRVLSANVREHALDIDHSNNTMHNERSEWGPRFVFTAWRQLVMRLSGLGRLP